MKETQIGKTWKTNMLMVYGGGGVCAYYIPKHNNTRLYIVAYERQDVDRRRLQFVTVIFSFFVSVWLWLCAFRISFGCSTAVESSADFSLSLSLSLYLSFALSLSYMRMWQIDVIKFEFFEGIFLCVCQNTPNNHKN